MNDSLAEPTPTRNEIRAVLADPASTRKQRIEAKLILAKRVASGTDRVRQICEHYQLPPDKTDEMVLRHQRTMGGAEAGAAEDVQRLERALEEAWE